MTDYFEEERQRRKVKARLFPGVRELLRAGKITQEEFEEQMNSLLDRQQEQASISRCFFPPHGPEFFVWVTSPDCDPMGALVFTRADIQLMPSDIRQATEHYIQAHDANPPQSLN